MNQPEVGLDNPQWGGRAGRTARTTTPGRRGDKSGENADKFDKKYWHWVEAALDKLYHKHSDDRMDAAWKAWENQMIKDDDNKYKAPGHHRGWHAASRAGNPQPLGDPQGTSSTGTSFVPADPTRLLTFAQDMEGEIAENEHGHRPPTFNLYQASALPVNNIPSESMNGDVNLLGLGDVAGTLDSAL